MGSSLIFSETSELEKFLREGYGGGESSPVTNRLNAMKSISLDDDLYQFIMDRVAATGQDPSGVLREYVPIESSSSADGEARLEGEEELDPASEELHALVSGSRLSTYTYAVDKYLAILSKVYQQKPERFEEVEANVSGPRRKYFGTDRQELIESGSSVNPKQIPESPYYTTTNNNTPNKRKRLKKVLRLLDYDERVVQKAADAI